MFATNNASQNDMMKSINLQIESNKVVYELVYDKIHLYSNNKLQKFKSEMNFQVNFLSKFQRKYAIDVIEKMFVCYVKNTNFSQDSLNHFSHSYLLSKINNIDFVSTQNVFEFHNLKNEISSYLFTENFLDLSLSNFRFTGKYF